MENSINFLQPFSFLLSKIQGSGKVKEHEVRASPLRLHVTDKDVPHTPAWRTKFTVHGAAASHFKVEMDGETNDGIVTVFRVRAIFPPVGYTSGVIYVVHTYLSAPGQL